MTAGRRGALLAAGVFLCVAGGCGSDDGVPDPADASDSGDQGPDLAVDDGAQEDGVNQTCLQCIEPGLMLRWHKIDLVEPSVPAGLPEFLNNIIQPDVNDYRINIGLRINEISPKPDGTLGVQLTAGTTWHDLDPSDVLAIHGGDKTPSWYQFMDGLTTEVDAVVKKDCTFGTSEETTLWFKSGPAEFGYMCSPARPDLVAPADVLPFEKAITWGTFDNQCTRIMNGRIDACIRAVRACEICVFILSPDYKTFVSEEDPSVDPAEPCLPQFCDRWCGRGEGGVPLWTNLGGFIETIEVPQNCEVNGDPGYHFVVNFEAEVVPVPPGS
ncbi:MAG: hypothetical protein ISR64_00395 [Deltaproteobacteria bacterium]|nr:hypothetical protein [Deltaproteobacteria bacterium]